MKRRIFPFDTKLQINIAKEQHVTCSSFPTGRHRNGNFPSGEREKKKSAAVIAATAKVYLATHFLDLDLNDKRPQA